MATCWDSLLVNGVDIQTLGWVVSAEGLLSTGPFSGDVIEQDWTAGAIWQPGVRSTYSFDVPVVMNTQLQDIALGNIRVIQGWQGSQKTLTRRLTVNGAQISETCQAVMVSAPEVVWNFERRARIGCVMVWQSLSGLWTAA